MDLGRILQVGPPRSSTTSPADVFVARFLGTTNLLQGQVDSNGNEARREIVVRTPLGRLVARAPGLLSSLPQGTPVTISIRPETLSLGPVVPPDFNRFPATIERIIFRGDIRQVDLRGPGDWPITVAGAPEPVQRPAGGSKPDPLRLTRVRHPPAGQVRGGAVVMSEVMWILKADRGDAAPRSDLAARSNERSRRR